MSNFDRREFLHSSALLAAAAAIGATPGIDPRNGMASPCRAWPART